VIATRPATAPDAAPSNATSVNVSSSTNFNGLLGGNPATGEVRVTDVHPEGTYTVTVRAFSAGGQSASRTFTLTVTTPPTCNPVTLAAPTNFVAGTGIPVAVGDFNGDGEQDLAVTNSPSNSVAILLGDGGGNFGAATNFVVGTGPVSVAVGDFNEDGKEDLAAGNFGFTSFPPGSVSILLGNGDGSFGSPTNFSIPGADVGAITIGDFNGDGHRDIAALSNVFEEGVTYSGATALADFWWVRLCTSEAVRIT